MADYRPIKIKMWHDNWFLSLTPEERLLWVFILTNEYVHISGIYELPEALISPLTGILNPSSILKKFEADQKVVIKNGFIFIRQYLKNQTKQINKKDNITKSIITYLAENTHFIEWFNLQNEAPYKPLITPLVAPSESSKEESSKGLKMKEETKQSRFTPPSLIAVSEYITRMKFGFDPQEFIDVYEARGWMVGKFKMKDWEAAVRTFQRNRLKWSPEKGKDISERRIL